MFEISLDGMNNMRRSVVTYAIKILKQQNKLEKCNANFRVSLKEKDIENISYEKLQEKHFMSLPYGVTILNYKDETIIIERNKIGEPLDCDSGYPKFYEDVIIKNEKNMDILMDFIKDSLNFYKNIVLDKTKTKDKITTWIFDDGYWDKLNKHENRPLSTIYIEEERKQKFIDEIKTFINSEKRYSELGIRYKKNFLLEGLPGTGKSSFGFAVASELNRDICIINFNIKLTDADFAKALQTVPDNSILFIEDMDSIFYSRKKGDEHKNMITFSGLLNTLDGIFYKRGLITFITTNYPERLDKALIRPGRIDYKMTFTYATKAELKMIFNAFYKDKKDLFTSFYKKIKHSKLTIAMVQEYFLIRMDGNNIIEDLDELIKRATDANYDKVYKNKESKTFYT